jgi:hypothetical protein
MISMLTFIKVKFPEWIRFKRIWQSLPLEIIKQLKLLIRLRLQNSILRLGAKKSKASLKNSHKKKTFYLGLVTIKFSIRPMIV